MPPSGWPPCNSSAHPTSSWKRNGACCAASWRSFASSPRRKCPRKAVSSGNLPKISKPRTLAGNELLPFFLDGTRPVPCFLFAEAKPASRNKGLIRLIDGDARDTGLFGDQFDLVHARLLLVHLARPHEVVREMVRITRNGGTVALHEVDWAGWTCFPRNPSFEEARELAAAIWEAKGWDVRVGRTLPALLEGQGLTQVRGRRRRYLWAHGHPKHRFLLDLLDRIRLEAAGWITATEFGDLRDRVATHLCRPGTTVRSPWYTQAFAKKETPGHLPQNSFHLRLVGSESFTSSRPHPE